MKQVTFVIAIFFISACSSENEKIYTVDELMTDQALLTRIIGDWHNNPDQIHDTLNGRDAEAAVGGPRLERTRKSLGG